MISTADVKGVNLRKSRDGGQVQERASRTGNGTEDKNRPQEKHISLSTFNSKPNLETGSRPAL